MPIVYYFIGFDGYYIHSQTATVDGALFLMKGMVGHTFLRFPSLPQALTFFQDHYEEWKTEFENGDKLEIYRAEVTLAYTMGINPDITH